MRWRKRKLYLVWKDNSRATPKEYTDFLILDALISNGVCCFITKQRLRVQKVRIEETEWTERKQISLQRRLGRCKEICMCVCDLLLSPELQSSLNQILETVIYSTLLINELK